eukprot:scaffold1850_cov194-Pinguiococcus_pyrenoidosus.AAC.40
MLCCCLGVCQRRVLLGRLAAQLLLPLRLLELRVDFIGHFRGALLQRLLQHQLGVHLQQAEVGVLGGAVQQVLEATHEHRAGFVRGEHLRGVAGGQHARDGRRVQLRLQYLRQVRIGRVESKSPRAGASQQHALPPRQAKAGGEAASTSLASGAGVRHDHAVLVTSMPGQTAQRAVGSSADDAVLLSGLGLRCDADEAAALVEQRRLFQLALLRHVVADGVAVGAGGVEHMVGLEGQSPHGAHMAADGGQRRQGVGVIERNVGAIRRGKQLPARTESEHGAALAVHVLEELQVLRQHEEHARAVPKPDDAL